MIYHNINFYLNELYNKFIFTNDEHKINPMVKICVNDNSLEIIYSKKYYVHIYPIYKLINNNNNIEIKNNVFCCKTCKNLYKNLFFICFNDDYKNIMDYDTILLFCKHYNIYNYILFDYNYYINCCDSSSDSDDSESSSSFLL